MVNRAMLAVGLAALDVCWIYPWSLLVALWIGAESLLSPFTMLALLLLAAGSTNLALRRLGKGRAQTVMITLAILATLVAIRIEDYSQMGAIDWLPAMAQDLSSLFGHPTAPIVALLLALLLWRRGAQLGSNSPTFPDVEGAFRWSVGALIAFALLLAVGVRPSVQSVLEARATPFVVGSFFVALLTLALARLESLRTRTQALALNTQWLGVLIAVAGLLVLVSLAVSQLLSFDLLILATRPFFDLLGRVVLILLFVIVVPLAYLIQLLIYWILQLLAPSSNPQPPEPPQDADIEGFLQRLMQVLPPEVLAGLKVLGAVLLLGIALLLVARTVARWRPRLTESDDIPEERDSVYQKGGLWQLLLAWLRGLFGRDARALAQAAPVAGPGTSTSTPAISSVRELYRRLLGAGAVVGASRPTASTPYEHEPALQTALDAPAGVDALTQAYVRVRYAELEPSPAELRELSTTLEEVLAQPSADS